MFIPYGPFCIAIGFIFGVYWGFLIQMGAIFLSSAMLFIIGRYLFKDYVSAPAASRPPAGGAAMQLTLMFRHARHRAHARACARARAFDPSLARTRVRLTRHSQLQVNDLISKSDGSHVWKGLMKYMGKDWKEVSTHSLRRVCVASGRLSRPMRGG